MTVLAWCLAAVWTASFAVVTAAVASSRWEDQPPATRPGRVPAQRDPAPAETLHNLHHRLHPCAVCPTRMAVPGQPVCTTCDAVTLAQLVPDTIPEGASW